MATTVRTVIQDIMSLWGIENPDASIQDSRTRAMSDLNKSVQMIWQNPEKLNYFNKVTITVTILANTSSIVLTDIQNVVGPVRDADTFLPLQAIDQKSEYENYGPLYYGEALPAGPPTAYYLDSQGAAPDADALALTLRVVPTPLVDTDIILDVIPLAPAYTWADYCAGSAVGTPIPIPHVYGETLLLPIARRAAMSYFLFFKDERVPILEEDYRQAREQLGYGAPDIDEITPEPKPIPPAPPYTPSRGG